jgi:hypothetical protein
MLNLRTIAYLLGGEVFGRQVLVPGPDHSSDDRSLSIRIEPNAPDGFLVHSFAGDDPIVRNCSPETTPTRRPSHR